MQLDATYLRIGRQEQMKKMRPLSSGPWSGEPITLSFRNGDMRDLARPFADISGLIVDLSPPEPYGLVTAHVQDVPWDAAWELIVASHGWTFRVEGDRIRVEVPPTGR